jgi:branched-chain amino acid aminotransferase
MSRVVFIDGKSVPPEEARISVYDRGFLYGDSVFETIRTYGGELFALDEHLIRLEDSAEKMRFDLGVPRDIIAGETRQAVAQAACENETYARVMITRGTGPLGLDTALAEGPCRVVLVQDLQMPPTTHYRDGISALCVETVRASDAAHSAKIGNYLASALALRTARAAGAAEALVVNRDGLVVEGTTSNVFAVKEGKLITPPLEIGILAGITRAKVIRCAEALGIDVAYETMSPQALSAVDELFLTSSIREVLPIVKVDSALIGDGQPGEITRKLHRQFRKLVGLDGTLPHEQETNASGG